MLKIQEVLHKDGILNAIKFQNDDIQWKIDRFTVGGSAWAVQWITRHCVNIYENKPIRAKGYIKLPAWINNKKLITINIQNNDDKSFIYCLARRFDPIPETKHLERVSKHLKKTCTDRVFIKLWHL